VHGRDYPLPYVRWTERRNGESFLELMARGDVDVRPLMTHHFPIERAAEAYRIVTGEDKQPAVAIVLEYQPAEKVPNAVKLRDEPRARPGEVHLGAIGAGQFAKGVLLPAFASQGAVRMRAFCTSSGLTSKHIAEQYKATFCTSDPEEIVASDQVNTVLVTTRHDQHAPLALAALEAGKAVFIEKPLCLTEEDLHRFVKLGERGDPRLMVGFNRRFSPLSVRCRAFFAESPDPLHLFYRVNAGALPADSWVYDPVQGGGRILGEVCHFVDMACYLTDSLPARVSAEAIAVPGSPDPHRDSVCITLRMRNDSTAVIHYLTNGDPSVAKEYLEVYGGKRTAILDNYRVLDLHQGNQRRRKKLVNQQKGFAQEVAAFVDAVRSGEDMPISLETLVAVTQTCFLVHRSLDTGGPVDYEAPAPPRPIL
jgi:polar amino acid transport system substrate-binding protein